MLNLIIKVLEGVINGLPSSALNSLFQDVLNLAKLLINLNPAFKLILEPVINILSELVSNPSNGTLVKSAVNALTGIVTNLLASSLSGITEKSFAIYRFICQMNNNNNH